MTLITGDTAVYSRDGAGHVSVTVEMGPGRDSLHYEARREDGGYYVFPDDTAASVSAGRLDKELFNVEYLAANGYTDRETAQLPVIVQYAQTKTLKALPGTGNARALASVNGAALPVTKRDAGAFWSAVRKEGSGVRTIWLDRKMRAFDDASAAQIGAPTAWAAGYDGTGTTVGIIDTGIDAKHPDLAGLVTAAQNFVPAGSPGGGAPADVTDRFGHGTHVAGIVAGSGAASGGKYKGVAPGARLIVAKALDDTGSGANSTIIEAMEWMAATEHAKIVSMSLGSAPTDGTDPVSQALDDLTARYGTLFVVAAGNSGPDTRTVAAPGTAASALTVGAVDRADALASFSSRGPRLGADPVVKPEITAPGWNIIAARAAGTSLGAGSSVPGGGPIDENYTAASGTSMATPHVSAAAAILLQEHPDWTAAQLKTALVGTAKDGGFNPYEQGSGRLDVGRAATQKVFDDVASVSGAFAYPYGGKKLERQVTYRNTGTGPVTLAVSTSLVRRTTAGTVPAAGGVATLSAASVTVPAGGSTPVTLTLDPSAGEAGWYYGRLEAKGSDGSQLAVPIAFHTQPVMRTLKVRIVGNPGWAAMVPTASLSATRVNDTDEDLAGEPLITYVGDYKKTDVPNTLEVSLTLAQSGVYSIDTQFLYWNADRHQRSAAMVLPELRLDGDTTVTLDAAKLRRIEVDTPRPSEPVTMNWAYNRTTAAGREVMGGAVFSYLATAPHEFWVLPTTVKPTIGTFTFLFDQVRTAPQVSLTLTGRHPVEVRPHNILDTNADIPKFTQDRRAGLASSADLHAGRDVRGKLVLLEPDGIATLVAELDLAVKAGAAGVLTNSYFAWVLYAPSYQLKIPVLWLDTADTATVRTALSSAARPTAQLRVQSMPAYEYKFTMYLRDRVPDNLTFRPSERDFAQVDTVYHAQFAGAPGRWGSAPDANEVSHTFIPGQSLSIRTGHPFTAPSARTEYYTVAGADVLWQRVVMLWDGATGALRMPAAYSGFSRGTRTQEDWNETVLPAQVLAGPSTPDTPALVLPCDSCRQGDTLRLRALGALGAGLYADAGDPSHAYQLEPGSEESHLFRDGVEVTAQSDAYGLPYYTLPAGAATYRFTDVYTNGFTAPHTGSTVTTAWTFRSARPATGTVKAPYVCIDGALYNDQRPCAWQPLLQLRYDLGLPADDTLAAGRPAQFTVTAQNGTTPARLAGMRVWVSPDGGRHWTAARATCGSDGTNRVQVDNPSPPARSMWLRVEAWDAAGNRVDQTIADAYRLSR